MASLTGELSVPMSGKETLAPPAPGPSIFSGIAQLGSTILDSVEGAKATRSMRDAAARQAAADARKAGERDVENAVARNAVDIYADDTTTADMTDSGEYEPAAGAAIAATNEAAGQIARLSTAARQGRASVDAVDLKTELMFRKLFKDHPGYEAHILETAKKFGVDSPLYREYEKAAEALDADEKFWRENEEKAITTATTDLGLDPNKFSRAELAVRGREYMAAKEKLDSLSKQTEMLRTQGQMSREEFEFRQDQISTQTLQEGMNFMSPQLNAAAQSVFNLANDPSLPEAQKEAGLKEAIAALTTAAQLKKNAFVTQYGATMKQEDLNRFTSQVDEYTKMMVDMLTGPLGAVQSSQRTLQLVQNQLSIDINTALPLYTEMKAAFGSQTVNEAFMTSILSNQKTREALSRELKNFTGIRPTEARTRLNNMISIIRGETGLRDYTPAEARKMLPGLVGTMTNLVKDPDVAQGADVMGNRAAIVAIGAVANGAVDANPAWGVSDNYGLALLLTNENVDRTLFGGGVKANKETAQTVINTWFPALQQVHEALKGTPTGDKYFDVKFDTKSGKYVMQRNNTPQPVQSGSSLSRFGNLPGFEAVRPSDATTKKLNGLNRTLNFLTSKSRGGWDGAVPREGISDHERRLLYAQGRVPAAMKSKEGEKTKVLQTWQQNIEALKATARESVNSVEIVPGDAASYIAGPEGTGDNPRSSATGTGQFIDSTWLDVAKRNFPEQVAGKSNAEILAMRSNPQMGKAMINAYARENSQKLAAQGLPVNPLTTYLMHFAGPEGGIKLLKASPASSVESVLGAAAVKANPHLIGKTVQQAIEWAKDFINV